MKKSVSNPVPQRVLGFLMNVFQTTYYSPVVTPRASRAAGPPQSPASQLVRGVPFFVVSQKIFLVPEAAGKMRYTK